MGEYAVPAVSRSRHTQQILARLIQAEQPKAVGELAQSAGQRNLSKNERVLVIDWVQPICRHHFRLVLLPYSIRW